MMTSATGKRRKVNGFSLLELVIAIAVLSVGIVAVLEAFSFSARVVGLSGDIINASFLAEDKMQELDSKETKGLINKEPTEVKDVTGKFSWGYTLNLDRDLNLYRADLEINWQRAKRKEKLTLNTYLRQ